MYRAKRRMLVVLAGSCVLSSLAAAGDAGESSPHVLVEQSRARACLVLGSKASWHDQFAADELVKYIRTMTGATLPIVRLPAERMPAGLLPVLIGRPETNPAIAGLVKLDEGDLTAEGFRIKTAQWWGRPCVVIAGVSDVGTVYAAYDLLERFGRVGFFRYEEHVPKRADFAIPTCDIRERPHFRTRFHGGQWHYFGIHWYSEAQWKENLHWYAKVRVNRNNYLPGPPVTYLADPTMWRRLGIETNRRSESRDRTPGGAYAVVKRLVPYAIRLGVRAPYPSTDGRLPASVAEQFKKKYPKVKYFVITRNAQTDTYVDPADPMWLRLNQARLENMIETFGDSKLYYLPSPWGERSPGKTPEEKERLTRDYATAIGSLAQWAHKKHPGAEWVMDCWALANKSYWQPYRVERMLNALPKDLDLVMWDYPAEDEPSYVYNNYWFKRSWAFIVLHSMAGNTSVHGDVRRLMGNVFRVLCDQRADKLVGFGNYTEANDYVPLFKDLVMHLAWDPFIRLDDFVQDYCERRYSPESVPAMVACHRKMIESVYGPESDTHNTDGFRTVRLPDPVYWFQMGGPWVPFDELQRRVVALRRHWGPLLRDALADALSVVDRERDNPAYVRDLADLMRSYVHVRMGEAMWDAVEAAHRKDVKAFEKHRVQVQRLFDHLLGAINLVSHRWEFGVNALIQDFADSPLKFSPKEIRHYLYYVTWSGNQIHDYIRTDRYEMIRDVHRPMTMAFLKACREQLILKKSFKVPVRKKTGWEYGTLMDATAIPARAHKTAAPTKQFVDAFINGPCLPPPPAPDPITTARNFLAAIRRGDI